MSIHGRQRGGGGLIFLLVLAAIAIVFGLMYVNFYNTAVRLDEDVSKAWSNVENQLKRRMDLIPNLVSSVKGYTEHEKEVLTHLADARKAYFASDNRAGKIKAASGFESALSRLLVFKENYPNLKANQSFLKLQDSLEGTENRISTERKRYNDAAKELNTFRRSFFGRFFAEMTGLEEAPYFELDEAEKEKAKAPPKVEF